MTALFYEGNSLSVLQGLPVDFFHCVVTSPPYFGLRRYDGGEEVWGGDDNCQHDWAEHVKPKNTWGVPNSGGTATGKMDIKGKSNYAVVPETKHSTCSLCGAWKGQLGAEPIPDLYIQHLVQICREVKRVLRPDGVFWLNIGDSWAGSGKGQMGDGSHAAKHGEKQHTNQGTLVGRLPKANYDGIKPLDMVLIPQFLALALRADGWYVRSQVIWSKNNPMPESVNGWRWEKHRVKVNSGRVARHGVERSCGHVDESDVSNREDGAVWQDCPGCAKCSPHNGYILRKGSWRPTDSYEVILMLTKTDSYYCDRDAVMESSQEPDRVRCDKANGKRPTQHSDGGVFIGSSQRNLRSVWEFPTKPYSGAHFATYPPRLVELCVKSSTSEKGCCSRCGTPYARIVEKGFTAHDGTTEGGKESNANRIVLLRQAARENGGEYASSSKTIGWLPTCSCTSSEPSPCRVLDPFSGAGTTALVCERLGLDSFNIDTSAKYIQLAKERLEQDEQKRLEEQLKKIRRGA